MVQDLKVDTAGQTKRIGPAVSVADGIAVVTSLDIETADQAVIIKNDGTVLDISSGAWTWAAVVGAGGLYDLTFKITDLTLEGSLEVYVVDEDLNLVIFDRFNVLSEAAYDSKYGLVLGSFMKVRVEEMADDIITAANYDESSAYPLKSADAGSTAVARTGADSDTLETISDEIAGLNNIAGIQKNAVLNNFEFIMYDEVDHITPKTGLTVSGQRSLNGGAFVAVSGAIAEVGNGVYQFDAAAADTNGNLGTWRFYALEADDTFVTFKTE